jgi:hypothetical protein
MEVKSLDPTPVVALLTPLEMNFRLYSIFDSLIPVSRKSFWQRVFTPFSDL